MIKRNEKPLIEQKVQIQDALQLIQQRQERGGGGGAFTSSRASQP